MTTLTSTKPYLIRALHEWILDNGCTPHVIVNTDVEDVEVPSQYIEDGRIVLNISDDAVRQLAITNEYIEFNARFNGVATQIYAPVTAIVAIYAVENGQGMVFHEEEAPPPSPTEPEQKKSIKRPNPKEKPVFRIVK
jgi:stringent starvation protein B